MKREYNRVEKRIMLDMMANKEKEAAIKALDEANHNMDLVDTWDSIETDFHGDFEEMSEEDRDAIINPKHYKMVPPEAYSKHPEGLEYIDLMEYLLGGHTGVQAHLLGQIYKYACRLGKKDSKLQDASKIKWYADRLVKEIEGVQCNGNTASSNLVNVGSIPTALANLKGSIMSITDIIGKGRCSNYQEMLEEMAYFFRSEDPHLSYTQSVVRSINSYEAYRQAEDRMFETEKRLHDEFSL